MAKSKKRSARSKSSPKRARKPVSRKSSVRKSARKAVKKTKRAKAAVKAKHAKKITVSGVANLLITYDPNHKGTAEKEVLGAFNSIKHDIKMLGSDVEGLFRTKVGDARKAVSQLRQLCKSKPGMFNVTHHYTPIDSWCRSELKDMQAIIRKVSAGIRDSEKWRMKLNKRHWDKLDGTKLIMALTEVVSKPKVDLDSPDKIIQVEIVGKNAGISLLGANEALDVPKMRV